MGSVASFLLNGRPSYWSFGPLFTSQGSPSNSGAADPSNPGEANPSTPSNDEGSVESSLANGRSQSNSLSPVGISTLAPTGPNAFTDGSNRNDMQAAGNSDSVAGFSENDPGMQVFMDEYAHLEQDAHRQRVQARIRQIEERQDSFAISRTTRGHLGNTRFELNPQPFSGLGTFAEEPEEAQEPGALSSSRNGREHRSLFLGPIDNMQDNFATGFDNIDIPMSNTSHPRVPLPTQGRYRVRSAAELAMMRNAVSVPKLVKPPFPFHPRLRKLVPDKESTANDNLGNRRHYVPAPPGMTRNDVREMEENRVTLHAFIAEYKKEHHTQMRLLSSQWRLERSREPRWRQYRVFRRSALARETKLVHRRWRVAELRYMLHESRGVPGADPYDEFPNQEKSCSPCGGPCKGT